MISQCSTCPSCFFWLHVAGNCARAIKVGKWQKMLHCSMTLHCLWFYTCTYNISCLLFNCWGLYPRSQLYTRSKMWHAGKKLVRIPCGVSPMKASVLTSEWRWLSKCGEVALCVGLVHWLEGPANTHNVTVAKSSKYDSIMEILTHWLPCMRYAVHYSECWSCSDEKRIDKGKTGNNQIMYI